MLVEHQWSEAEQQCGGTNAVSNESALLQKYSLLVKRAAAHLRTLSGPMVDADDLLQVGLLGLLSAIRRYGREPDEFFEAYAFKRVRGAMLDEFRRTDWRARQQRQEAHQYRDAGRELMRRLGRAPSHEELSQHLGIDSTRLHELMYLEQAESMESLDTLLEQQQHAVLGETSLSGLELKMSLKQAMAGLPERNKLLLHLYYSQELNMKEIALVLELTESRVCQLHKQSIEMLNNKLSQW